MIAPAEIKTRREALGLTQRELGGRLGVTGKTVGNWEKSRYSIPIATQHNIEQAITAAEREQRVRQMFVAAHGDEGAQSAALHPSQTGSPEASERLAEELQYKKNHQKPGNPLLGLLAEASYEEIFDRWSDVFVEVMRLELEYSRRRGTTVSEARQELWRTLTMVQQALQEGVNIAWPWGDGEDGAIHQGLH